MKKLLTICLFLLLLAVSARAEDAPLLIAQNERLRLYLSADLAAITVEDAETGAVWSSSMNDETFSGKINALWKKKMSSLLMINYTNIKQGLGVINNMALLADKKFTATYEPMENGARVRYDLGASAIALTVEITLDEDSLLVRVPKAGIEEYGEFSLVSVDMMPFLCSASNNADGYFLYPDGSGAIMEFRDDAHINESTQLYSVYGSFEKQERLLPMFSQEEPTVLLPVYGMVRGGHGLLAIIESGDETSRISLNCSNNILKVNYLFANFQYRRGFDDRRVTTRSIKVYDGKAIDTDYALRVKFLPDERASYSGMACAYRDYLMETGALTRRDAAPEVSLDIFLTTAEDGLLFDTPRTVTTLAQAGDILDALHAAGVRNARVTLKGWSADGWGKAPDAFPLNGTIGGDTDMRALAEKARGLGYTLSLAANVIEASSDQDGYSKRNDVVYLGNYTILTNLEEDLFMLSPDVSAEKYKAFESRAKALALDGARLERLGLMMGYNYGNRRYLTSAQAVSYYRDMLIGARETLGTVAAEGGAAWLLPYVDQVTGIPFADHGYQFTTRSVPFYQMVLHGLVSYAAEPGNLSSDLDREVLRWIEMGYSPYFEMTYENTEKLMYTAYKSLFTAEYGAWLNRVAEITAQFREGDLSLVRNALMLAHERVSENVYRMYYDNGMCVYVNYGAEDAHCGAAIVPAMGYSVVREVLP